MTDLPEFHSSSFVRALERLVLRGGRWKVIDIPVRYGLWQHARHGPVLIDTGYSTRTTQGQERSLALKVYARLLAPRLVSGQAPAEQLRDRGFEPGDVTHIILTHFHADHVAGLRDFPRARFLASGGAFERLSRMSGRQMLHHAFFPELLPDDFGDRLMPFESARRERLPGGLGDGFDILADGSVYAVPLPGHAIGHFGLYWPEQNFLYAADTQWLRQAIMERRTPRGPARLIYSSGAHAEASAEMVRRFAKRGGHVMLCHEPTDATISAVL